MNLKIQEIDNCIGWNYADKIEALITSMNFPWCHLNDIIYVELPFDETEDRWRERIVR